MNRKIRAVLLVLVLGLVLNVPILQAVDSVTGYHSEERLGFQLSGKIRGTFQTQIYKLQPPLGELLISVDIEKSPGAKVRAYARVQNGKTTRWTQYKTFENEFLLADPIQVSAFQLMFVIVDFNKEKSEIKGFTVRGNKIGGPVAPSTESPRSTKPVDPVAAAASFSKELREIIQKKVNPEMSSLADCMGGIASRLAPTSSTSDSEPLPGYSTPQSPTFKGLPPGDWFAEKSQLIGSDLLPLFADGIIRTDIPIEKRKETLSLAFRMGSDMNLENQGLRYIISVLDGEIVHDVVLERAVRESLPNMQERIGGIISRLKSLGKVVLVQEQGRP